MKKYFFILLIFLGCETFDVVADNPLDPNNPDYELPTVSILDPQDGQTISSDKLDVYLQGNENVSEYRYKINSFDSFIDMKNTWSVWSSSNIVSLEFLNEYSYELTVQSRYPTERESNGASIDFTVDAVKPGSLILYPKKINSDIFTNFNISLYSHDLPNISALDIIIEFDTSNLEFRANDGSQEYGDVNVLRNSADGKLNYTIGKYGDNGFGDNELILTAVFWSKDVSGTTSYIKIISATAKSLDGQTIEIVETNQTRVYVK